MQTEQITFKLPVYKDQTNTSNTGKIIEVGDTVVLLVEGDTGVRTATNFVVTHVSNQGKTIGWNRDVSGQDYRTNDIARTHLKHQFTCPPAHTYTAASCVNGPVKGAVINGITYAFPAPYHAATTAGATSLQNALNSILNRDGWAAVTLNEAPTPDCLLIVITGTKKVITSVDNNGTAVLFTVS